MRCDLTVFAGATGSYSILSATKKKEERKKNGSSLITVNINLNIYHKDSSCLKRRIQRCP